MPIPKSLALAKGISYINWPPPLQITINNYNQVISETNQTVYRNEKPGYRPLTIDDLRASILFTAYMSVARDLPDEVEYFGDKTPSHMAYMSQIRSLIPSARFIHIIRDGRDVLVSFVKHMQRTQPSKGWTYEGAAEMVATKWSQQIQGCLKISRQLPGVCHEVHYESLLATPEDELKKIHRFLDFESSNEEVHHCIEQTSFEKLSGGRKAGEENKDSFFRKGVAGDWKQALPEDAQAIFHKHAGDLLKTLGYEQQTLSAPFC